MTLSDKRLVCEDSYPAPHYLEEDVKAFIKELRSKDCACHVSDEKCIMCRELDKLAGEKLI